MSMCMDLFVTSHQRILVTSVVFLVIVGTVISEFVVY